MAKDCFPPSSPPWCRLVDKLATEATGLRDVRIYYDSEGIHSGGGRDVNLVRALGRIRGLEKLGINKYYAKEWPAYLKRTTGVEMVHEGGLPGSMSPEYRRELEKFQRGPDLNP